MSYRLLVVVTTLLLFTACASKPPPAETEVSSDRYAVELRRGDMISVTLPDEGTSSFCFGFVDAEGIHAEGGPRIVPLAKIQKLTHVSGGCLGKGRQGKGIGVAGEVVGIVVVAPFILVCMLAGGCSTQ